MAEPSEDRETTQDRKPTRRGEEDLSSWYRLTGLGVEFIVAVGMMTAAGWYLDKWLQTQPVYLLIGLGVGFAVGLWMVIRTAMKSFR